MKYDIWSKYYQFGGDTESFKAVSARGADEITIEVQLNCAKGIFCVAAWSKLQREKPYSEAKPLRQKNMTQLGQHVRTKRYQVVCTRRRKVHGDFKLRYPEKVVKRKRTSKRSKDTKDGTTCEKIDRTLRFSYQQKITQKVPRQRFVYKLSKHSSNIEPEMSASRRSKSSPFDSHAGFSSVKSLSSTISPVGKSSHQSVMPLSHCPHCLCPRFLSATKSSGSNGRIMVSGRPSQKEADLPLLPASARSIPVSVIQRISFL